MMRTEIGDIWQVGAHWRGIPTNGVVTNRGLAVMGRGVALQAKQRYPGIDLELGRIILNGGNHVWFLHSYDLYSFPTKHHWRDKADVALIRQSVYELRVEAMRHSSLEFNLPLPGTGNGGLVPSEVWPLLQDLPDNVTIVVREGT